MLIIKPCPLCAILFVVLATFLLNIRENHHWMHKSTCILGSLTLLFASSHVLLFLQDILENDDIQLDLMFIASIVFDIIRVGNSVCFLFITFISFFFFSNNLVFTLKYSLFFKFEINSSFNCIVWCCESFNVTSFVYLNPYAILIFWMIFF